MLLFFSGLIIGVLGFHIYMTKGGWELYFLESFDDMPEDDDFLEWLEKEENEEEDDITVVGNPSHTDEKEDKQNDGTKKLVEAFKEAGENSGRNRTNKTKPE